MDGMSFACPPQGLLSEQIDLPELFLSLGLIHLEGAGLRVARWNGEGLGHMSQAAARRFAKEMRASPHALELLPAIRGLEVLADRVDAINAEVEARKLVAMEVEGHA